MHRLRYLPCNPIIFKPGLLVEAQASLSVVPIARKRYLMLCKLRSICLIDNKVFKVSKSQPGLIYAYPEEYRT